MKQYEYKVIRAKTKLGLDFDQKAADMEKEWNELGKDGWKFCAFDRAANEAVIFMREITPEK